MKITDCKIKLIENGAQLKGIANVSLDNEFLVRDIKIVEGKEGLFIAMPSRKVNDNEFRDIAHPINSESRNELQEAILKAYEEAKIKAAEVENEVHV